MPDDLKRKSPEDPKKININQDWELDYWSKTLSVNKSKIISAVKKVGPMLVDVKRELSNG